MNRKLFHPFLLIALLLTIASCDMARYYFRHGGRGHKHSTEVNRSKSAPEELSSVSATEDRPPAVSEVSETVVSDEPITILPSETTTFDTKQTKAQENSVEKDDSLGQKTATIRPETSQRHQARMHANGAGYIWLAILMLLALFAMTWLMIFLVAWIFVPIAAAIRIAWWGLLITVGIDIIVVAILLIFS